MKLYIKRDKTVDGAMFAVFDQNGRNKYYVRGDKNTIKVCTLNNKALLSIKRLPLPGLKAFSLTSKERSVRFIINPKKYNCFFYGISWQIRGDFFSGSFEIIGADNSVIASHSKSFSSGEGSYELDINSEHNELFCIGIAVCSNLESKVDKLVVQPV